MNREELKQAQPADQDLDAELARMAEDAPPMPADFHARWMSAVRAEAEKAGTGAEESSSGKTVFPVRWTRILSIAAVFVFLIGGTLLYRRSGRSLPAVFRAGEQKAAAPAAVMPETEDRGGRTSGTAEEAASEEAALNEAEYREEPDFAPVFFMNAAQEVSGDAEPAAEAWEEAPVTAAGADEDTSYSGPADAGIPAQAKTAPLSAAMPAPAAPEQEEAEEEGTAAEGFLAGAGAFLADMGGFLLAALPYLAVLAVPAVTALVLRRRKR